MKKVTLNDRKAYWYDRLIDILMAPFYYDGLPSEIPSWILEYYLLDGQCALYRHTNGDYIIVQGSPYGVTYYPNLTFDHYVFAIPNLISKSEHTLNDGIVLLKSNPLMRSNRAIAEHYADLLAHTETTYMMTAVNMRIPSIIGTSNPKNAADLNIAYGKVYDGDFSTFLNNDILNDTMVNPFYVPPHGAMTELITALNNLLRKFYTEVGIVLSKDKTQAVLSDESTQDYQLPAVNLERLYNQRVENCDNINRVFGLNVSVHYNKAFKPIVVMADSNNSESEVTEK